MKILNISTDDYSNFAHENAKALRSVGVDCDDIKFIKHPFGYESESKVVDELIARIRIQNADTIQIFHSDLDILKLVRLFDDYNKKIVVYHTGSRYRSNPIKYNSAFNPIIDASFTDQCEFMNLGAKNLKYIATAIDTRQIGSFGHEVKKPVKIGHYPSNSEVKGTNEILNMLSKLDHEFILNCSTNIVNHKEQYKRMDDCDIYIELFKPELNGKPYGCFGVTAFEAAAAGKVVVTQNFNEDVYKNEYGECPFIICNSENQFLFNMNKLLSMPIAEVNDLQTKTYKWVNEKHSYKATGERLCKILQEL